MTQVGLTNTDLSTHDNLVQARHELQRADTMSRLAEWADKWGEAACDAIENPELQSLEESCLRAELDKDEKWQNEVREAIQATVTGIDRLTARHPDLPPEIIEELDTLMDDLEDAAQ